MAEESHDQSTEPVAHPFESTGNAELDEQLAQPVLKGDVGLDRAMAWVAGFLIVIAGLVALSGVLNVPFHATDHVRPDDTRAAYPASDSSEGSGPDTPGAVGQLSLLLNPALPPNNATAFHTVSLLLHLLNGVLVYLLCRRIFERQLPEAVAMLSGLFFVLHPVNVEAVASFTGRGTLLGSCFALASILLFVYSTGDRATPRWRGLGLALLAYASAVAVFHGAWAVPLLLVFVDLVVRGPGFSGSRVTPLLCGFAALAVLVVAGWAASSAFTTPPRELGSVLLAAGEAARRAVWPVGLSAAPSIPASTLLPGATLALVAILTVTGAVAAVLRGSVPGAGLAWFGIALIAAALAGDVTRAVANPILYLPLAGLTWAVPWAFSKLPRTPGIRTSAALVCTGLLLFLGITAFLRVTAWQSEIALWQDAARKAPEATAPRELLGNAYLSSASRLFSKTAALEEEGYAGAASEARDEAERQLRQGRETLSSVPEELLSAESLYLLGMACRRLGDPDAALQALQASLRKDDANQACALEAAQALQSQIEAAEDRPLLLHALDYYEYARRLGELPPEILPAYGAALVRAGRFEEGAQALSTALETMQPAPGWLTEELTAVQKKAEQLRRMEGQAREWEQNLPGNEASQLARAQSMLIQARPLQAGYLLEEILRREDAIHAAGAWAFLGDVRARMGQSEAFLAEWPDPPVPEGEQPRQWSLLALMCAGRGDWAAAERYLLSPAAGMTGVQMPLVTLGEVSLSLGDAKRAHEYLTRATDAYPGEPAPWLALCDLSIAVHNAPAARQYLAEAKKCNAPQEEIAQREEKLDSDSPAVPAQPGEVIIR